MRRFAPRGKIVASAYKKPPIASFLPMLSVRRQGSLESCC